MEARRLRILATQILKAPQVAFTCSKLTTKTLEQSVNYVQSSGDFIVNFEKFHTLF